MGKHLIKYYWFEQRSPEWYAKREKLWTGSTIVDLMNGKKEPKAFSDYDNLYMKRGRMLEPLAIEAYIANEVGVGKIRFPGFVTHSAYPNAGYSPDGIDGNILLEVKCLNGENHEKLVRGEVPTQYMAQVQLGLMITGHKFAKLIAYNPDSPNSLAIIHIKRNMKIRNNIKRRLTEVAQTSKR
jgi:hypothetical protein